jgi:hypothetical protein
MGSTESHYTASKLYPALLAKRPLLAAYHRASTVSTILERAAPPPAARLVTYDDEIRAECRIEEIHRALVAMMTCANPAADTVELSTVAEYSAEHLAGKLAKAFDAAVRHMKDACRS